MKLDKSNIKTIKFWIRHQLKPYVRTEPIVKHLNIEYFWCKELDKFNQDFNLSCIKQNLTLKDIIESKELTLEDKKEFARIHFPELFKIKY